MANGLLVWPVGLMIGVQQKWSLKRLLIFLVLASIAWLAYFSDFQFVSGHSNPWDGFENLWILAQYVAIYLGNPISPFWREYAMGIGFLGIFSTAFLGIRFLLVRGQNLHTTPAAGTLFGISVFVLMTAIITAFGRIEFGLVQATSSRYATPALIYWIATCTLLFSIRLESQLSRRSLRRLGIALGLSAIASAIAFQFKAPEISQHRALTRSVATAALLSGVYDEPALQHIHPRPAQIKSTVETLRAEGMSLFSMDIAKLIAQPLEQFLSIVSKDHCAGHIDEVVAVTSDNSGFRIHGWAIDRLTGKRADKVVFLSEGVIRGIAFSGRKRPDVEELFPAAKDSGWLGYAKVRPGTQLRAYALVNQGQSACLLNGVYEQSNQPRGNAS